MSGTTISNLTAISSIGTADLVAVVRLGSPNVTYKGTVAQLLAVLSGDTLDGPVSVTNPGTAGNEVLNFSQFNPTVAMNGFIHFPGGVTLQWGFDTTNSSGNFTVTFPYTFSGSPYSITVTANNSIPTTPLLDSYSSVSDTSFTAHTTLVSGVGSPSGFSWVAMGPT